jgi:CII-binding regulator of phage lambda lysogenization HflD
MAHECIKQDLFQAIQKDIDNLNSLTYIVTELKTIVEMLTKSNSKHEDILDKQSQVLTKLTENVSQQTELVQKLNDKIDNLDNKIIQQSISDLKNNSMSFQEIFKMVIEKAMPPIIIAGLTYLVLQITNKM